ncbi:MAG: hypothetical protein D6680_16915 [Cyanobacteria bacterium J007]|nr:MAG: hypothetical protein D6680_16915 [Cyanobacteria bacterium J007]
MNPSVIDRLGDLNPQLLRELKGRLQRRHLIAVGVLSGFVQLVLYRFNDWLSLVQSLYWLEAIALFILGSYLIHQDIAKEESRGTLYFLRLSPQSSRCFYWGKLLGVPILLYWAIALAVPLQLLAQIKAGIPLIWLLSIAWIFALGCGFLYTMALLMPLNAKTPTNPLGTLTLSGFVGILYAFFIFRAFDWPELTYGGYPQTWFNLPVGSNPYLGFLTVTLHVGLLARGLGWVFDRRFRNSRPQLHFSQGQVIAVQTIFQLWFLGWNWHALNGIDVSQTEFADSIAQVGFMAACLILALATLSVSSWSSSRLSWWQLVRKQSAIVAIVWLPWFALYPIAAILKLQSLLALLSNINLVLSALVFYWITACFSKKFLKALTVCATTIALLSIPTLLFQGLLQLPLWETSTAQMLSFNTTIAVAIGQLLQTSLTVAVIFKLTQWVKPRAIAPSSLNPKQGD